MKLGHIFAGILGVSLAVSIGLWSQEGGGPEGGGGVSPGGSDFSTQFNDGAGALGGAGPGSAGEVLTSNGAGMAPSFQAAGAAGCVPTGDENEILLDDGMGDCGNVSGLGTSGQILTSNGMGMAPTWEDAGGGAETATFNADLTDGYSTTPTLTFRYYLIGSLVILQVPPMATNLTSDSSNKAFNGTPVPAEIRPTTNVSSGVLSSLNNGSIGEMCVNVATTGALAFAVRSTGGCVTNGWSSTGNSRTPMDAGTITYSLL
jgi:hypothetical protein